MTPFVKNILVYADGRIQVVPEALLGRYLMQHEVHSDGSLWERTFNIEHAVLVDPKNPERTISATGVAIERSFTMKYTGDEMRRRDDEQRRETMERVLRGLRNG